MSFLTNRGSSTARPQPDGGPQAAALRAKVEELTAQVARQEAALADLQRQLNEVRADGRHVAELYDLVMNRLREDNPLRVG